MLSALMTYVQPKHGSRLKPILVTRWMQDSPAAWRGRLLQVEYAKFAAMRNNFLEK